MKADSLKTIYQKLYDHQFIETERLRLRPVSLADAEAMYFYASDEANLRYSFEVNTSLDDTRHNIARFYLANPLGRWGIELKATGQFIGTLDMHNLTEAVERAEFGYVLKKAFWNKGYMTETAKAFIQVFFEALEMNCLVARHDKANPASGSVLKKAGMLFSHEEPYAKRDKKDPSRIVTMCHYRLTKEDYFKKIDNPVN